MRKLSRNHKFLIAVFVCVIFWTILIAILVSGCNSESKKEPSTGSALILLDSGKIIDPEGFFVRYKIVYDPDTLVEYVLISDHIAPLYNADGTLKLYSQGEDAMLGDRIITDEYNSAQLDILEKSIAEERTELISCEKGNHEYGEEFVDMSVQGVDRDGYIFYPASRMCKHCGYSFHYMQGYEMPRIEKEN